MRGVHVITIFLTLLFISWSTQDDFDGGSTSAGQDPAWVMRSVNEFGYKLLLKMMRENVDKNIVMSPTGVAGLLAMTLLGSAGSTYDELAKALGFSQDILKNRRNHERFGQLLQKLNVNDEKTPYISDDDITTTETNINKTINGDSDSNSSTAVPKVADIMPSRTLYANAIVVDANTRIRNVYWEHLTQIYRGDAISTHFADADTSQKLINDWVKNNTGGKIEEFLSEPLPVSTRVVLLSALYFSGQWARPFLPEYTRKMTFDKPSGQVMADLMLNLGGFDYIFKSHHDVHMIAFPYNDSTTTMYVLKPFHKNTTLLELLERLDNSVIEELIQNMTNEECVVRFPKMELATKIELQSSLKALGLKTVFTPGDANFALMVDADDKNNNNSDLLSRINETGYDPMDLRDKLNALPNPGVYVDSVLHDVKMTVNEYGTTAVAASSGFLSRTAKLFYADSPFYMFIRNEKSKLITFSAVIFDPTQL